MKLEDILFSQGFGTRYDCRKMISDGVVKFQSEVVLDPDQDFNPEGCTFEVFGEEWPYYEKAIIALNKPANFECSMKPSIYPSVMTLLPSPLRKRNIQPVGRLDQDTTGLIILTDDGKLIHTLTHPKKHVAKTYIARLKHVPNDDFCRRLEEGVVLNDDPKPVRAVSARMIDERDLELVLDEGKYHQVKRMVAALSNRVESLHRIKVGKYELPKDLKEGEWCWIESAGLIR